MPITKNTIKTNENEKVCDFEYIESGTDYNGYPIYTIKYTEPPLNYSLVHLIEPLKIAILKDLDYTPIV